MVPPEEKNDVIVDAQAGAIILHPVSCAKTRNFRSPARSHTLAAQTYLIAAFWRPSKNRIFCETIVWDALSRGLTGSCQAGGVGPRENPEGGFEPASRDAPVIAA